MGKLVIFLMLVSLQSFALTGETPTLPIDECIQKADVIFYGRVKSHEFIPSTKNGHERKVVFTVLKTFKGKAMPTRTIYFNRHNKGKGSDAPSGLQMSGETAFIFTSNSNEPTANIETCSIGAEGDLLKGEGNRFSLCKFKALSEFEEGKLLSEVKETDGCPWPKDKR